MTAVRLVDLQAFRDKKFVSEKVKFEAVGTEEVISWRSLIGKISNPYHHPE